jgi:hypothetical protein
MRRVSIGLVLGALLVATSVASAGSLSYLSPYNLNKLEDHDFEGILKKQDDGSYAPFLPADPNIPEAPVPLDGDIFLGMWEVTGMDFAGATAPSSFSTGSDFGFTAVFALAADGTPVKDGNNLKVSFRPLTSAEWSAISFWMPSDAVPDAAWQGMTIGTIFDDHVQETANGFFTSENLDTTTKSTDDWKEDLETATSGAKLWEIGFTGAAAANEWWTATIIDAADPNVTPKSVTWEASMNVTRYHAGPLLLSHNAEGFVAGSIFAPYSQVGIDGGIDNAVQAGDYWFPTDTNIWIRPTPEPGTLALLGLGLAAVGGVVYRRRRQK